MISNSFGLNPSQEELLHISTERLREPLSSGGAASVVHMERVVLRINCPAATGTQKTMFHKNHKDDLIGILCDALNNLSALLGSSPTRQWEHRRGPIL